jgi:hypothetical protein
MPRSFAMSVLVDRCQKRCDLEGNDNISPEEWKTLISEQYGELYAIVADAGLRYFEKIANISTTGSPTYGEPADHLGTVMVLRVFPSGERRRLRESVTQEMHRLQGVTGDARKYALVDRLIYLLPVPPTGQQYEIRYVPQPADLSGALDADEVDVVNPAGESFLIWGVAVKAHAKGSSTDIQTAIAERNAAKLDLMQWAADRALLQPRLRFVDEGDDCDGDGGWRDPDWYSYR